MNIKMYVDTENGFKFLLQRAWGSHYGPANKEKGGNYSIDGTTALYEGGEPDAKYILLSKDGYAEGIHTIVLDTVNGTISVTPQN